MVLVRVLMQLKVSPRLLLLVLPSLLMRALLPLTWLLLVVLRALARRQRTLLHKLMLLLVSLLALLLKLLSELLIQLLLLILVAPVVLAALVTTVRFPTVSEHVDTSIPASLRGSASGALRPHEMLALPWHNCTRPICGSRLRCLFRMVRQAFRQLASSLL